MLIKAVSPYIYPNQLNFKDKPFNAWKSLHPDAVVSGWYPKFLHRLLFEYDVFPTLFQRGEARLIFVQPVSLFFDVNISVLTHEVIPYIWDCWPCYYDKMEKWLKRHKVKTAIFTSSQEMEAMKQRCPHINMFWCPEAVDSSLYNEGKPLKDRTIDLLEFGRSNNLFGNVTEDENIVSNCQNSRSINHINTKVGDKFIFTDEELYSAMGDAKITICFPRSITHPDEAQGIETLTQRYWESMLSRMIIIGHAPQELIDICGYNPVIEVRDERLEVSDLGVEFRDERLELSEQIINIFEHIEDYQDLVDKNRRVALEKGDWSQRIELLTTQLKECNYSI